MQGFEMPTTHYSRTVNGNGPWLQYQHPQYIYAIGSYAHGSSDFDSYTIYKIDTSNQTSTNNNNKRIDKIQTTNTTTTAVVAMSLFTSLLITITLVLLLTIPIWEYIMFRIVSSNSFVWNAWPHWSRFVHAALPLQLLMVQMSYRFIQSAFLALYHMIRNQLIEYECYLYEQCVPLTLIEQ
jgi:hypothetical protein